MSDSPGDANSTLPSSWPKKLVPLPIDEVLPEIEKSLIKEPNLVLVAPPGSGKTTRVAPYLIRKGRPCWGPGMLIMLQPRRVAVRAASQRISEEQGWALGDRIGYQIRFEKKCSQKTQILIVTEALLTRMMIDDPYLEGVAGVLLDEFHERSLHSDLAIARLRELQTTVRPDLRILVMSATLMADPISHFLGEAPILKSEGRPYPVEIHFHNQTLPASGGPPLVEGVFSALRELLNSPEDDGGDVLVFLPGAGEIRRCLDIGFEKISPERFELLPLHGNLTGEEQDRALRKSNRRKLIFATNIAETSLTIDGVSAVVDSGLARVLNLDAALGTERLDLVRISKASAEQRAGRAGRQRPGRCYRLWTKADHIALADFQTPEVWRSDLSETVLQLASWGYPNPAEFRWFEPPLGTYLQMASRLLGLIGAVDLKTGTITSLGENLLHWPIHPRLSRVLFEAVKYSGSGAQDQKAFIRQVCYVLSILQEADFVRNPKDLPSIHESDVLSRLEAIENPALKIATDRNLEKRIHQAARQLEILALAKLHQFEKKPHRGSTNSLQAQSVPEISSKVMHPLSRVLGDERISALLLFGYPDRVTRRRGQQSKGLMVGGRGVIISDESSVHTGELFLSLTAHDTRREGRLETRVDWASRISKKWLQLIYPEQLSEKEQTQTVDGALMTTRSEYYLDIPIEEPRVIPTDPRAARELLIKNTLDQWSALAEKNEALAQLLARIEFARTHFSNLEISILDPDSPIIQAVVEQACQAAKTVEQVVALPLASYLRDSLSYQQLKILDEIAPASFEAPSRKIVNIRYEKGRSPWVSIRLQELFGLRVPPKLAKGRISLTFELLGPNFRPVQVTADLESFWSRGYPEVRKELRARYPKHNWPEDPHTATPGTKRRRT